MDQSTAIFVEDSSDDEITYSPKRPAGMDTASWQLIQSLDAAKTRRRTTVQHFKRPCTEEADRVFALQIQQDEHRQCQMQEQESMAMALQIQEEEEFVAQKKHKRDRESVLGELTPCQLRAVHHVTQKARDNHERSLPLLQRRVEELGFCLDELSNCFSYIRDDAPIIIHLTEATLSLLIKDTHYRNLFETHTSGGSKDQTSRIQWETCMFGTCYDNATPHERPKYGCLNVSGDLQGVPSARAYGQLFLMLHPHIRYRTTFFHKDTGGFVASESLATNDFYAHVLNSYNDTELTQVLRVCESARLGGARSHCSNYKEVQIHGGICLTTDIQALSIPGREQNACAELRKNVETFREQTRCNIFWQEDLLHPET